MLGLNALGSAMPKPSRNHGAFVVGDACIAKLVELGLVESRGVPKFSDLEYFVVTDSGKALALASVADLRLAKARPSRAKRRYQDYLRARDLYADLTFMEYLRHPHFKSRRDNV